MFKLKNFSRDLWSLLRPFWTSEERRSAWLLLRQTPEPLQLPPSVCKDGSRAAA